MKRTAWLLPFLLAACAPSMDRIAVSPDGKGFVEEGSGRAFVPWGANYDHDRSGRLIEDYWDAEWETVGADFREMKDLGANVVRVHLQFGRFMKGPAEPDGDRLSRLMRLCELAERTGLRLDVTGLGCYHRKDTPAWYDALDEEGRWAAQEKFWEAVATACSRSPAVFCYDLMNEPVVPGEQGIQPAWLGPEFGGKCFVQFVTRETAGRRRPEVARAWIARLAGAIRKADPGRLVTVGLVDWSLDRPATLTSGFPPADVSGDLDFVSVHLYPVSGQVDEALRTLDGFSVGKPVLVEETFPLRCTPEEFEAFLQGSRRVAAGWLSFYWGATEAECRADGTIPGAMMAGWLARFRRGIENRPADAP